MSQTKFAQDLATLRKVEKALANVLKPLPKLKVSEWANSYRQHSPESSSAGGGNWRNFPMQVEPQDSVLDPSVRSTVLQWSSQTAGKTEILNNITGYFIHQRPSPQLMIQPTLEMAKAWSEERLKPMARDTPVLKVLISERTRDGSSTILHKTYPGGHLAIAGANSPPSLASRPIRIVTFDEIDRYPESAGKEGDPIMIAEKRTDTFHDAVNVKTSTPTIKNRSRIEKEFDKSDKRYWFVACPVCGHKQTLRWTNLVWDPENPETAHMTCESESCGADWTDKQRIAAVMRGEWLPTAPFHGIRGYHLNGLYSLFKPKKGFKNRMHQAVVEFLEAKRLGKEGIKVWTNTFLAETFEEEPDIRPDANKLFARREPYRINHHIPLGIRLITAGLDFQKNRIELEFVGYGVGEESWGLGTDVIYGDPCRPEIYIELEKKLNRHWIREDNARLELYGAGFDTGYHACQRQLYTWLRPRVMRSYFALKGANTIDAEPVSRSPRSKVDKVFLIMVGTNRLKNFIYQRSTIATTGPGFMHFPMEYSEEWFKQLLSEECTSIIRFGITFKQFKLPEIVPDGGTSRNEGLDMRVYSLAALYAKGTINWDIIEKRLKATIPPEEHNSPQVGDLVQRIPLAPPPIKKRFRRRNFLSSIRF